MRQERRALHEKYREGRHADVAHPIGRVHAPALVRECFNALAQAADEQIEALHPDVESQPVDALRKIGHLGVEDDDFTPNVANRTPSRRSARRAGVTRPCAASPAASRARICNCNSSALRTAAGYGQRKRKVL